METLQMYLPGNPALGVTVHTPAALKGGGTHGLPPSAPRHAYEVDAYPAAPANWKRSRGNHRSYFTPVRAGQGMWLNFNSCWQHEHDVAIVVSVQGINPVTGAHTKKRLKLEQYKCGSQPARTRALYKCPVHGDTFEENRMCPTCGFAWPGQNYLATTGTPHGLMWIDGFRGEDGVVRQYLFTEDAVRGVAAQLIGEERVYAIGVAFYTSKNEKPKLPKLPVDSYPAKWVVSQQNNPYLFGQNYYTVNGQSAPVYGKSAPVYGGRSVRLMSQSLVSCPSDAGVMAYAANATNVSLSSDKSGEIIACTGMSATVKQLDIAAGAKIQQRIYDDPKDLDYWNETPAGVIYVNYCDEEACAELLKTESVATKAADAFMGGLKVGN